jgi:hypothetical protein
VQRLLPILIATALAAGVPLALAGVSDRVKAAPVGNEGVVFSQALGVIFTSPPDYRRGCCYDSNGGEWLGPKYEVAGYPTFTGDSSIDWSYTTAKAANAATAVRATLVHSDGREVESGALTVLHTVAGRTAGTIPAFYVITRFAQGGTARHEAGLGFPIGRGFYGVARWALLSPADDSAQPFGDYRVKGMLASQWNRTQAQAAVRGVALDGSLPPTRVRARAAGRRVRGEVRDSLGHPVAGAKVTLERRVGRRWRPAGSTRSGAMGAYSMAARRPGTYRVAASLAATTARSTAVRVR